MDTSRQQPLLDTSLQEQSLYQSRLSSTQVVHNNLVRKYNISADLYFTRDVNRVVADLRECTTVVAYKEQRMLDSTRPAITRYYVYNEAISFMAVLVEYYKYHLNVPAFYHKLLIPFYEYFYARQRRILYQKVQGMSEQTSHYQPRHHHSSLDNILVSNSHSTLLLYQKLLALDQHVSPQEPLLNQTYLSFLFDKQSLPKKQAPSKKGKNELSQKSKKEIISLIYGNTKQSMAALQQYAKQKQPPKKIVKQPLLFRPPTLTPRQPYSKIKNKQFRSVNDPPCRLTTNTTNTSSIKNAIPLRSKSPLFPPSTRIKTEQDTKPTQKVVFKRKQPHNKDTQPYIMALKTSLKSARGVVMCSPSHSPQMLPAGHSIYHPIRPKAYQLRPTKKDIKQPSHVRSLQSQVFPLQQ